MKTYKTNAKGWSPSEELHNTLKELGILNGFPTIKKGAEDGSFWLFGKDVDKMNEMMERKRSICIESVNRKFVITTEKNDKALLCKFTITLK